MRFCASTRKRAAFPAFPPTKRCHIPACPNGYELAWNAMAQAGGLGVVQRHLVRKRPIVPGERMQHALAVSETGIDARMGRDSERGSVRSTRARPPEGGRPPLKSRRPAEPLLRINPSTLVAGEVDGPKASGFLRSGFEIIGSNKRADATGPAQRRTASRPGRPELDPGVHFGPAVRLDIDRRVSDASTVKTAHPTCNPPKENAYRM